MTQEVKNKHVWVLRDLEDNLNYIKTSDDCIKKFETYSEAVEFAEKIYSEIYEKKVHIELIDITKLYVVEDKTYGEGYKVMNMYWLLNEINRDRSSDWTDYDQTDFDEGIDEWTNYEYIGRVGK